MTELEKWKPEFERGKNFSMLVLASRGSGKSYLTQYLLTHHLRDKYDLFVTISDSEDELEKYREILPGRLFFDEYNPDLITEMIAMNKARQIEGKPIFQILVIFDDKISNKMRYSDQLLQLFTRGRHVGISIIFISQSHVFAASAWRNNSDMIIVLKQNAKQARDAISDNILIGSMDVSEGVNEKRYYMALMRKYINKEGDAIVLDFKKGAFDNLFQYRAPAVKKPVIKAKGKRPPAEKKPKPEEIAKAEVEVELAQEGVEILPENVPPEEEKPESSESAEELEISDSDSDFEFFWN